MSQVTDADVEEFRENTGMDVTVDDLVAADAAIENDQAALDAAASSRSSSGYAAPKHENDVKAFQDKAARDISMVLSRTVHWYKGADRADSEAGFVGTNGHIYVNINSPITRNGIAIVLGHEYVHTLEGTDEYNEMRNAIFASEKFAEIQRQTGMSKDQLIAQAQSDYAEAGQQITPEEAERELVAQFIGENLLQSRKALEQLSKTNGFRQFLVRIRRFLARLFGKLDKHPDLIRIERLLQQAVKAADTASRTQKSPATSSGVRYAIGYKDAIEQLSTGKLDRSKNTHLLVLDKTPQIYIDKAEAKDLKIVMRWDIAYLAMNKSGDIPGHYHGLGKDVMKAIPAALKNPLYVVKQNNGRIVAVTEVVVKGSRSVIVSVELDAFQSTTQDGKAESDNYNLIVTVMDAKPNYLQNTIFGGEIVYNKNNEDPAHFILRLKSLKKALSNDDHAKSSTTTIPDSSEKSNTKNSIPSDIAYFDENRTRRGNGYDGYSMSNNARDAYENGEMPLSKWRKSDIVDAVAEINPDIDISGLKLETLKQQFLRKSSWHHTSMYYNATDFYSIDDEYVKNLTQSDVEDMAKNQTTSPKVKRDTSFDDKVAEVYKKILVIVESGILKTKNAAIKRFISGKGFEESYKKAVDLIRKRDISKVNQWRRLPPNHYRQEYVRLYDADIEAYVTELYASEPLSKNSTVFKIIEKHFSQPDPVTDAVFEKTPVIDNSIKKSLPFGFSMTGKPQQTKERRSTFQRASVDAQARILMNASGAKGDRAELTEVLEEFYEYVARGKDLTWESIDDAAQPVVDWLTSHRADLNRINDRSREILRVIRETSVRLDDVQKAEVAARYGSYEGYRRKAFGTINYSNSSNHTLESRWLQLAERYPEYFDPAENAVDMPFKLLEIADSLRGDTFAEEYEAHLPEIRQELSGAVYDSYWNVSESRSVEDRYEDKIYDLKAQHRADMREQRAETNRAVAEEKERGDVRVKQERQRARDREQALKDHYRVQRERATDRRNRTEMRDKIRRLVKDLEKMLLVNTKERNVKNGLREVVARALSTVETVDTEEYERNFKKQLAYLDQTIYAAPSSSLMDKFQKDRDNLVARYDGMKQHLSDLAAAYSAIIASQTAFFWA